LETTATSATTEDALRAEMPGEDRAGSSTVSRSISLLWLPSGHQPTGPLRRDPHGCLESSTMVRAIRIWIGFGLLVLGGWALADDSKSAEIPKPEHPRPDAMRTPWANLNGRWDFRFDVKDQGLKEGWEKPEAAKFDRTIVVPFPWESELSGIK